MTLFCIVGVPSCRRILLFVGLVFICPCILSLFLNGSCNFSLKKKKEFSKEVILSNKLFHKFKNGDPTLKTTTYGGQEIHGIFAIAVVGT